MSTTRWTQQNDLRPAGACIYPGNDASPVPQLIIRPASLADLGRVYALHQHLSAESLYARYHRVHAPTKAELAQICNLDGKVGLPLVAIQPPEQMVGLAHYVVDKSLRCRAEFAIIVADKAQNKGVGKLLLHCLIQHAQTAKIKFLDGLVQADNRRMMHLLLKTGYPISRELAYGVMKVRLHL